MESNSSLRNLTLAINRTTAKHAPYSCLTFSGLVYLEKGDGTIVNAALNVVLSVVTTIANILVFPAIRKSTSLYLPSKLLLCGLVLTDLGVGLVVQPLFTVLLISLYKDFSRSGIGCFIIASTAITGTTMSCASVMTMELISLDRYIAFHFHLRYKEIVTANRVVVALVAVWLNSVFVASTVLWNAPLYNYIVFLGGFVVFLVTSSAYIKIYYGLRQDHGHNAKDQAQVEAQQQAGNTLNVAKYRRTVSNMLWVYCVFILCYLPFILTRILIVIVGGTVFLLNAGDFATTVVFLNSCLNPFLYCYRLPEIRANVLQRLRKICGESPQQ